MRAHGWWRSLKDRGAKRAPLNEGVRGEEAQGRQLPGKEMEGGTSPPEPLWGSGHAACCTPLPKSAGEGGATSVYHRSLPRAKSHWQWGPQLPALARIGSSSRKTKTQREQETAQGHTISPRVGLAAWPLDSQWFFPPDCT